MSEVSAKLHHMVSLMASGHAYDKHVLGHGEGDKEFSNSRFGSSIDVRSPKDLAKLVLSILTNPEDCQAAYDISGNRLVIGNNNKNLIMIFDDSIVNGDFGSVFRAPLKGKYASTTDKRFSATLRMGSRQVDDYEITDDPTRIKAMIDACADRSALSDEAKRRLSQPDTKAILHTLSLYDQKIQNDHSRAKENKLATKFIRFAKKNAADDYEITPLDNGAVHIAYLRKDGELAEFDLSQRATKHVMQNLSA